MSTKKARLYRTAKVTQDVETYKAGDFVAVHFVGRGSFGLNFRISAPNQPTIIVSDAYLTDFVL